MAGQDWNVTAEPANHLKVSLIPQKIRDIKSAAKTVIQREHVDLGAGVGGQHLKGAARVYLDADLPSIDPESNNLDTSATSDDGRIAIATGGASTGLTNTIKVYIATSAGISTGWKDVRAAYAGTAVRVSMGNNVFVKALNISSASRNLIGLDGSNVMIIGASNNHDVRMTDATVGGDDDKHLADKKYVDDRKNSYILLRDKKTNGTDGGTFTKNVWQTRDLTEETTDTGNDCTLSSNQITLAAGTYEFSISAPGKEVTMHQVRLYNTTDAAVIAYGTSEQCVSAHGYQTRSFVKGRFTIADGKALEVQHRSNDTKTNTGFGLASSFGGEEVYTIAEFRRIN